MNPKTPEQREPGRSFNDPNRPMGANLIAESGRSGSQPDLEPGRGGIAERAKAVAVMRKAEELMSSNNPPPSEARRAFELAAGRVGLTIEDYDKLVKGDTELENLEAQVIANAKQGGLVQKPTPPNVERVTEK